MLSAGDALPACTLTDHDGNAVDTAAWSDRRVLVWFYPKADTPG